MNLLTGGLHQFSHLLPVVDYLEDEKLFIMEGGYIGIGIIAQPTPGVNRTTQNIISSLYTMEYPKGTFVQYILAALPDITNFTKGYEAIRGRRLVGPEETRELADAMSRGSMEYYNDSTEKPLHPKTGQKVRNFENWYMVKMPIKEFLPNIEEVAQAKELMQDIIGKMDSMGCAPTVMTGQNYIHRMQVLLNSSENPKWKKGEAKNKDHEYVLSDRPINHQILEPSSKIEFKSDSVQIGSDLDNQRTVAISTFKEFPEHLVYGNALDLVGDWADGSISVKDNFILSLHIYLDDAKSEMAEFNRRRGYVQMGTNGKLGQKFEKARFQRDDYDAIKTDASKNRLRLVKAYLQLAIFSNSEEEAHNSMSEVAGYYESKQFQLTKEKYIVGPMFLSQLPFGLDGASLDLYDRYQTYTDKTLAFLTPHIASWKGNTNTPVVPLVSRLGQAFGLDIFKTNGGFNALVAASTGSGKSFFVNSIIESYMGSGTKLGGTIAEQDLEDRTIDGDGAQIFVVDVGRSYEPLAAQYEGSAFVEFNENMNFTLDPFGQLDDGALEELAEENKSNKPDKASQVIMILNILKAMASEKGDISDFQSALMLSLLSEMIEKHGNKASITMYASECIAHSERDLQKIGHQLQAFCETGTYGMYFTKNKPKIDLESNFIVCELEALKSLKHLQTIVLMSLITAIQHKMFMSKDGRRRIFILDEAWEFLKANSDGGENFFASYIESGWRRFRKANSAGICITQSVLDTYKTEAGLAIANNSPWKFLLRQEREEVERLVDQKAFDATETDIELLKSVHTQKGVYSEIFIRFQGTREICRFYADRRKQLLYSTDPADKRNIQAYRDQGYTFPEAIDMVYQDERGTQH